VQVPDFIAASVAFHDLEAMAGTFKSGTRNTRSLLNGSADPENSESPVSLVAGGRNTRPLRNAKGDPSGSPLLVSQVSVVAGARNTRFLRLVEQAIPKLAA
jgi:hypothetical protein